MTLTKIVVTLDRELLADLDRWVAAGEYLNRSDAMRAAIHRLRQEKEVRTNLLRELSKLDPAEERAYADEFFVAEKEWPRY